MGSTNIVTAGWARERIEAGDLVVVDIRFKPTEAGYGRNVYEAGHLPGAVFVDFKAELTDPHQLHGGRSPLPSAERLAERFGRLGIDRETPVLVYEDVNGPAASRFWWVLKYLGHNQVHVLDGGFEAWTAAGYPVVSEQPQVTPRRFIPVVRDEWLIDYKGVKERLHRKGSTLVDSRDAKQYQGLEAPYDPVAGHIPGAVHHFWKDGLKDDGKWKDAELQRKRFAGLNADNEIIVYCGSGISATPNVLALVEAGFSNVKLYGGSWSDWISYSDNPIATGKE